MYVSDSRDAEYLHEYLPSFLFYSLSVVFNNIEDAGVKDSTAYLRAHVETVISDYALVYDGYPVDLCEAEGGKESADEQNDDDYVYYNNYYTTNDDNTTDDDDGTNDYTYNVDDAYFHVDDHYFETYQVSDAEECPKNGVYQFQYEFDVPSLGRMWRATGFKAYGDVKLASEDELLGSCQLNFETKAFGLSSKTFFAFVVTIMGVALFVGVLLAIRHGGGFLESDVSNYFRWLGSDVVDWCSSCLNGMVGWCISCFRQKKKKSKKNKKDLDSTFESDSTPSYSEKADTSLDTSLETATTSNAGPIRVRDFLPPPPSPTKRRKENRDIEFAFQYGLHGENPPSPIRSSEDPPGSFLTSARDDSVQYSPPRRDDSSDTFISGL